MGTRYRFFHLFPRTTVVLLFVFAAGCGMTSEKVEEVVRSNSDKLRGEFEMADREHAAHLNQIDERITALKASQARLESTLAKKTDDTAFSKLETSVAELDSGLAALRGDLKLRTDSLEDELRTLADDHLNDMVAWNNQFGENKEELADVKKRLKANLQIFGTLKKDYLADLHMIDDALEGFEGALRQTMKELFDESGQVRRGVQSTIRAFERQSQETVDDEEGEAIEDRRGIGQG